MRGILTAASTYREVTRKITYLEKVILVHHATIGQRLYKSISQRGLPAVGHSGNEKTCSATEVKGEKKEDSCEQTAGALPSDADDDLHVAGVCWSPLEFSQ